MKLLKSKAIFQIIILICATIYISIALAEPVNAASKVCCEKTSTGSPYNSEYCIFTDPANCDTGYQQTPISCQQTDYCGPGCCIKEGECKKNTPRTICIEEGGVWRSSANCEIPQCQKGCCSLPTECAFTTQAKCAIKIKDFEALQLSEVFDSSITTELECLQECRGAEKGCCLTDPCKFTTRGNCPSGTEFKLNTLCSYPPLGCACTAKHHTDCLADRDGVYWFDSCGNIENIYGTTYRTDGKVVPKENSCNPPNSNENNNVDSVTCGNCDYSYGSVCRDADDDFLHAVAASNLPANIKNKVKHMCSDLSCDPDSWGSEYITLNFPPWDSEEKRKNGQTWCEYEGAVGEGKDLVGSRHYRHVCINGRIIVEECKEKREEICIQGDIPLELFPDGTTGAICRPNLYPSCFACNEEDDSCGLSAEEIDSIDCGGECDVYLDEKGKIRKDMESELKECCNKQKCREKCCSSSLIDCYWHDSTKLCAPAVPPGNLGEEATCLAEEWKCVQVWAKASLIQPWRCEENCDCHKKDFGNSAATFCRSLGDCGAHYNVVGEYSDDGFTFKGPDKKIPGHSRDYRKAEGIDIEPWGDFNTISKPINGSLFFATYASLLAFSIASLEDIGDVTLFNSVKDFLTDILVLGAGLTTLTVTITGAQWGDLAISAIWTDAPLFAQVYTGAGAPIRGVGMVAEKVSWRLAINIARIGVYVVIAIAILLIIASLLSIGADKKEITYTVSCEPWVPPDKGEDCEKCNDFTVCDKYKCESLGRACELRNAEFPGEEVCTWVNRNDMTPPVIRPLPIPPKTMEDLELTPEGSGTRGYAFRATIKPYTPLDIGITTNKYAQCKISRFRGLLYDEMANFFGNGTDALEHRMTIPIAYEALPEDDDTIAIDRSGLNAFYVKCKNVNGVANTVDYFIKFRVSEAPDLIPPIIEDYSIPNGAHLPGGVSEIDLIIYLNEPASPTIGGCKYSTTIDQAYQNMPNSFTCSESAMREGLYPCATKLTGLQDKKDNVFYFKCRDKAGNTNDDDQPPDGYHLLGTDYLNITSAKPTGTLYVIDINLTLTTANGAENGKSICYYSTLNYFDPNGLQFSETDATTHSQALTLASSSYKFYTWCSDTAGNEATTIIEFTVSPPKKPAIEHIYKTDSSLHITLTEESKDCQYSTKSFSYGEGTAMTKIDSKNFELSLENPIYYIICESTYGIKSDVIKVYA